MQNHHEICPTVQAAFELISRKWVHHLIYILKDGEKHYCDIKRSVPDLSDRMLVVRMKEIEEAGLVTRTVHPGSPVRVTYRLTQKGIDLTPVLNAIAEWAENYK